MTNIQKLIDCLTQKDYQIKFAIAKSSKTCVMCGQAANSFTSELSAFEYNVSSFCEPCQNTYFYHGVEPLTSAERVK